jgi:predicted Ser/Thr protein kinase
VLNVAVTETGRLLADRYRVLKPLGTGGMATVFLAEDERLGRRVAVKRLHAHSPDDMALRFQREAKLGASLNHPNLVSVFDTVTDDEGVLIVMEYVEGETLADVVRRGRVEPERALEILRGTAAALDEAHRQGVVHRDVKPGNVLLGRRGDVKLADLGIGTATESTKITREGALLGTPSYMAPEQLQGGAVGPPADIYGFAAVAFELLGGRKARPGQTPLEIAHKVASEPPPDVREAWPEASPALARALKRGMAVEPRERPASAGELVDDIAGALSARPTEPTLARPPAERPRREHTPPPPRRSARPVVARSRRGIPAWVPAAVVLVLVGAGVVALATGGGDDGAVGDRGSDSGQRSERRADRGNRDEQQTPAAEESGQGSGGQGGGETPSSGGQDFAAGGPEDAALGQRLNDEGYRLAQQGKFEEAVPKLQQAVKAFPAGSIGDLPYAYALYNLGWSLNRSGRPDEAIPVLEERLKNPNQRAKVQAELDRAKQAAD